MVFASAPPYHDSSNWQSRQIIGSTYGNPPPQQQNAGLGSGLESGTARVGSMTERARLANIPIPEAALKCPRCDSSNTKFCYFNNYSLSQPRHFCKTCRRYWTRGGALRTVPVGGGYRHNKRTSKPTSAANSSPAAKKHRHMANSSPAGGGNSGNSSYVRNLLNVTPQQLHPLRFGSPLSQLGENIDMGMNNYVGSDQMGLQLGQTGSFLGTESWKLQQFPFLDASPAGNYQFGGGGSAELGLLSGDRGELRLPAGKISAGSLLSQMSAVKMEEQNPNLRLSTELLSGMQANQHQWNIGTDGGGGPSWAEFSNFSSSSTSNHLL